MIENPPPSPSTEGNALRSARNVAILVYALQVAGLFLGGVPTLIGLIINYVKRADVQGTYVASHFRWQIRTFWYALLWTIIGVVTLAIYIGMLILGLNLLWVIYRIVRGALALNDRKPMYA